MSMLAAIIKTTAGRGRPAVAGETPALRRHTLTTMIKAFSAIFISVFLAEIGDKTQLATMLFASEAQNNKWMVFAASATALVLASAIGVLVGAQIERFVKPSTLKLVAGAGVIIIGLWTMLSRV